jgi:hypothetical protein
MMIQLFQRARSHITEAAAKYGPAFFVTTGVLSFLSFWSIYFFLVSSGFNAHKLLLPYKSWLDSFSTRLFPMLEHGGPFAVAFVLNRLVAPFRYLFSIALLPYTAPRINRWIQDSVRPCCMRHCPTFITEWRCCCSSQHSTDDDQSIAIIVDTSKTHASEAVHLQHAHDHPAFTHHELRSLLPSDDNPTVLPMMSVDHSKQK